MIMTKKETPIAKKNTASLRKMAREQEIEGWEDMEREELIVVLSGTETPEPKPEVKPEPIPQLAVDPKASIKPKPLAEGVTEGHVPIGSKAERMREHLAKQLKVRILIPTEPKEKPGMTVPVILNSYRLNIMKGVYVDVPEQVAEIIMKSQKQTMAALNNPLNLSNSDHPKKMSGEGLGNLDA